MFTRWGENNVAPIPINMMEMVVGGLNRKLNGWANTFALGRSVRRIGPSIHQYLHEQLGLVCLSQRTRSFPWAKV
jgi:hypothetical protein